MAMLKTLFVLMLVVCVVFLAESKPSKKEMHTYMKKCVKNCQEDFDSKKELRVCKKGCKKQSRLQSKETSALS